MKRRAGQRIVKSLTKPLPAKPAMLRPNPEYGPVLYHFAYEHAHSQARAHERMLNMVRYRDAPNRAAHREAAYLGGSIPSSIPSGGHRQAPTLRPPTQARRTSYTYPLGVGAAPPLQDRKPEPCIANLLCGAGDSGNARLSPHDEVHYQRRQEVAKSTTHCWMHGRPSVGLPVGDVRGLTKPQPGEAAAHAARRVTEHPAVARRQPPGWRAAPRPASAAARVPPAPPAARTPPAPPKRTRAHRSNSMVVEDL